MGIGVSGWRLAGAVGSAGGLGVVSGVALDSQLARRLQDGDADGTLRRALSQFPVPEIAKAVLSRYFVPGGRRDDQQYRALSRLTLTPSRDRQLLAVVGAFVEVHLAKQAARGARVGMNLLEKIQLATPAAAYGAMLAGVDVVLAGAGIPARLPSLLNALAHHRQVEFPIDVAGAGKTHFSLRFDPVELLGRRLAPLVRPLFLAIVSSHTLAAFLARDEQTRPDGFVVEGPIAGGHNAPPRGAVQLDERGDPLYGPKDEANPPQFVALGLPFWLAGGFSRPEQVTAACAAGASGVQVGTLFALSEESAMAPALRLQLLERLRRGDLVVRTDVRASPTGFPFKVARLSGTLSEPPVYQHRRRVCDLGYLRTLAMSPEGTVVYRCPAEPVAAYVQKGGDPGETADRVCLCNALIATIGLAQPRRSHAEPAIATLGADLDGALELLREHPEGWAARDVLSYLAPSST